MLAPYRLLLPYFARYRRHYLLGALCVVSSVALKMLVPMLLGRSMDQLRHQGDNPTDETPRLILYAALAMVGAATLSAGIRVASRLLILGSSRNVVHDLRRDMFAHLVRLAPSFYVRHQTGNVMSRCVNDMQHVQGLTGPVFMHLVETAGLYLVGVTFMLAKNATLTAWMLLPFPLFLLAARRMAARVQAGTRVAQERLSALSAKVDESLSGSKVVKSLAIEQHDLQRFEQQARDYRDTMLQVARVRAMLQPSMMFLALLCTLILLGVGVPMVVRGELALGDMVAMLFWLQALASPTATLGFVVSSLKRGAAALQRVGELIHMPITVQEAPNPSPGAITRGEIEVRNLSIGFAPLREQPHLSGSLPPEKLLVAAGREVLRDISFTIRPGQTLGVVGATGAGKTTLLRALSRQIEVERGQVFIDGTDVNDIALAEHRGAVGMVPQETFLFSLSLADNIALGQPEIARDAIAAAAESAQLGKDLHQLPDGLDTLIGERGVNLSGGQRQRTALARVLLLHPRILLLDDTLSAVDTDTADQILTALRPIMAQCTTVLVAHRVATLRHADNIIVLDAGRIAESGTHSQLLARDGLYAALHRRQSRRVALQQSQAHETPDQEAPGA